MNCITIELCAEDRARVDRLIEALERKSCDACVNGALAWSEKVQRAEVLQTQKAMESDELQQKLAETLAKASDPVEAPAPVAEPEPASVPVREVGLAEFQKALTLRCAESEDMKAKVRALLHEYASAASQVPEDKRAEVLERLAKL